MLDQYPVTHRKLSFLPVLQMGVSRTSVRTHNLAVLPTLKFCASDSASCLTRNSVMFCFSIQPMVTTKAPAPAVESATQDV